MADEEAPEEPPVHVALKDLPAAEKEELIASLAAIVISDTKIKGEEEETTAEFSVR